MLVSEIGPPGQGLRSQRSNGFLGNQITMLAGMAIFAIAVFCYLSLASWSVTDPSFTNANGRDATNMLGFAGAAFADVAMQVLGLASALALVPPALWGWWMMMRKPISAMRNRVLFWVLSVALGAFLLAGLPVPESWPLPIGLGGVAGDMAMQLPTWLMGDVYAGPLKWSFLLASALGCIWTCLVACGLLLNPERSGKPAANDDLADAFDDDEDRQPSWLLGAIGHVYYSWRYRVQSRKRDSADEPRAGLLQRLGQRIRDSISRDDDALGDFETARMQAGEEAALHPHVDAPDFDAPAYGEQTYDHAAEASLIETEWAEQPAPTVSQQPEPAGLVKPMAPPPRPSSRVTKEAQPSLINLGEFELPPLHFLSEVPAQNSDLQISTEALEQNARLLEGVLEDFGVRGEIINVHPGPVVTLYELEPAPGIKSSRVIGLADDIARSMSAIAARVAVVPGRNAIGIELPNTSRETVYLREILASQTYEKNKAKLPLILGKTIGGEATIADLAKMPHLLVAGTTGSGKSVAINTMILSILYRLTPQQVRMIMIDPKMLELSIYDGIPHLLTPVVTDPKKAVVALKWTVREMEERYKKMSKLGVRNIDGYNSRLADARKKGEQLTRTVQTGFDRETGEPVYETEELAFEPMPYIVVIIDEMADLMMVAGKDIEGAIQRLAQMARAAGIHVIMATQRPSVDVITGTIKANFPTRISFQVTSKIDSRTILGEQGAEQLLGMGDMLYMAGGGRIQRVHGPFVGDNEVDAIVAHLKTQGVPEYLDSVTEEQEEEDPQGGGGEAGALAQSNDIYDQAVAVVLQDRKVSTSYIQRRLGIGYNRAATLIERMEEEGLISAANHAGKREILVPGEDETI